MTESLVATFETRRSGSNMVKLTGALDENSNLESLLQAVTPGRLVIHMGNITRVDSAGKAPWVAWLASLDARGVRPDLVSCSPAVVDELNADIEFVGCATVKSIQVVYRCLKCKKETPMLVSINEIKETEGGPERACETCTSRVSIAGNPDNYFAFIPKLPRMSSSPSIASSPTITPSAVPPQRASTPSDPPPTARSSRDSMSAPTRRSEPLLRARSSANDVLKAVRAKAEMSTSTSRDEARGLLIAVIIVIGVLALGFAALLFLV